MPELPEVETIRLSLTPSIIGLYITDCIIRCSNLRYPLKWDAKRIISSKIVAVKRRAKYLIIELDNNESIIMHFGMSGTLTLQPSQYQIHKHDHVVLKFDNNMYLVFNDTRRFGMVYVISQNELDTYEVFYKLGPEPLTTEFNAHYCHVKLRHYRTAIKNVIMNNHFVVGVGNIYASESLFYAKIHPIKQASQLSEIDTHNLVSAIKTVLAKAIAAGGTTLRNFIDSNGKAGHFTQQLFVYGRGNQPCINCTQSILSIVQSGRKTYYCASCQKR